VTLSRAGVPAQPSQPPVGRHRDPCLDLPRPGLRRRPLLSDGEPFELATSYYPLEIARGTELTAPGKIRGGAVALLKSLGYRSVEFI
jgi:hypothetical protein